MTRSGVFVFGDSAEEKRFAPATLRNRDDIACVLTDFLPQSGLVLEIASGTGEHLVHFATLFPGLSWQPSDYDKAGLASITAWSVDASLPNIRPPLQIDASAEPWPIEKADAILCINMVHISPWAATLGLLEGAARILQPGGLLFLYGPYRQKGIPTAASNEDFDQSLKERNADWGVRQVEDIIDAARTAGLTFEKLVEMPANNLSLIFRQSNT
jgi:SAM-dependent methyltransferase